MDKKKTILIIAGSSIGVAILSLLVLWIIAIIKERSVVNGKHVNENNDEKSSVEKDTVKGSHQSSQ